MSAEEARRLLEGATPGPWVANMDDDKCAAILDWRVVDTDVRFAVSADWYERHSAGETETVCGVKIAESDAALIAAAPDLAATVIALSEERDRLRVILDRARDVIPTGETVLTNDIDVALADYDANFMYATTQ